MTQTSRGAVGLNEPAPSIDATSSSFTGLRHLLDTKTLSISQAREVLMLARQFRAAWNTDPVPLDLLKRYTVATVFYENSTRTRVSFELAAKRLGATVVNLDIAASSTTKGETLIDTGKTLAAMGVNLIVQRHSSSGAAHQLARALDAATSGDTTGGGTGFKAGESADNTSERHHAVHIVNAGDGCNEHPTQALLDLLTMGDVREDLLSIGTEARSTSKDLPADDEPPRKRPIKVAIVGDILHSRVARSNIWLLNKFGADVHVAGPPTLVPQQELTECGVTVHHRLEPALQDADFVIVLRMQFERQKEGLIPSLGEYKKLYRLDHARMQLAAPGARILHPGPVNRDLEITSELADDNDISLINTQVSNGVFVRMAILSLLLSQSGAGA